MLGEHVKNYRQYETPEKWFVDVMVTGEDRETGRRETEIVQFQNKTKCRITELVDVVSAEVRQTSQSFSAIFVCYMAVYRVK